MTIDNHPLTPKPVDDREAGAGDYQVTAVDREAAGNAWVAWRGKSHMEDEIMAIFEGRDDQHPLAQAFARHREQAERGLVEGIPLRFDPRLAKQWWMDRNTSSFVSAKLAGDGYVKFQWRDADESGGYSVPWVVVALDMARKALDTRP